MEKNSFISLLKRFNSTTRVEAEEILALKEEYPYSGLLQTLAARVTRDHNFDQQQAALQEAAIYSADRAVLKDILGIPFQPFVLSEPVSETIQQPVETTEGRFVVSEQAKGVEQPAQQSFEQRAALTADSSFDVADEVMRDLEKLNALKHNFEMLFVEYSEVVSKPPAEPISTNNLSSSPDIALPPTESQKDRKSKKERIIELAKSRMLDHNSGAELKKIHSTKKRNPSETLIDEIQSTKQELEPESPKQKEQIEMINQFIKTQPSITAAKERTPPPTGDLNPIKSGEFGDNIVSETLVEILIKQGKKEKAIEVLKKLIWKYPQKKTYFASQIEDLKK